MHVLLAPMPCAPSFQLRSRPARSQSTAPVARQARRGDDAAAAGRLVAGAQEPAIELTEADKSDGNVRLSELAILALAVREAKPGSESIEIGTFDSRTALNLAISAAAGVAIATLNPPPDQPSAREIEASERRYVDKPAPGARLRHCGSPWRAAAARVQQLHRDSATVDWSEHLGRAGAVFVDGSHAYDHPKKDSNTALRLVGRGAHRAAARLLGLEGVTRALKELEAARSLGLVNIRGSSLVFWRAGWGAGS